MALGAFDTNRFTRKFGTEKNVVEPYITGYFHTRWTGIPTGIDETILAASTLRITIPQVTVGKTEFNGLGGLTWTAPTSVNYENSLTIGFLETQDIPITRTLRKWVNIIRNVRTGLSELGINTYNKSQYAGNLWYWTSSPNGDIQFTAVFCGVFPTGYPTSSFGHDLSAIDKLEFDQEFSLDYMFENEDWIRKNVLRVGHEMIPNKLSGYPESMIGAYTPEQQIKGF